MQGQTGTKLSRQPPPQGHNRYKTLPAQRKTPVSDHLARAGRKLSRSRHKQPEQGEHFSAAHHPLATQHTLPGTKLSGHTASKATTGTKLSRQPPPQGQTGTKLSPHSKKRPFQPIRREQGENYPGPDTKNPSRENLFPQTTTHEPRSAHAPVQNSPGTRRVRPNRYKTLPAHGV